MYGPFKKCSCGAIYVSNISVSYNFLSQDWTFGRRSNQQCHSLAENILKKHLKLAIRLVLYWQTLLVCSFHRRTASSCVQYPEKWFLRCYCHRWCIIASFFLTKRNIALSAHNRLQLKWENAEYFIITGYILAYLSSMSGSSLRL